MLIKKLIKNQKGDTIVEVLISIAIMSLILSVSYSLSNKDTQYIQQSQERSEAQKIGEQQLELLRNYLTPDTNWTTSGYKCFYDSNPGDDIPAQPTAGNSGQCKQGTGNRYTINIAVTATNTYTVTAKWAALTNTTQQNLAISYKLPASLLNPDDFLLAAGSTVTVEAKSIKPRAPDGSLVSSAGTANPACTDSTKQNISGTNVNAKYIDLHGHVVNSQSDVTDGSSKHDFTGFQYYGKYQASANRSSYTFCTAQSDPAEKLLNRPATNLTFHFVIKPNCSVTYDHIRDDPVYSVGSYTEADWGTIYTYGWNYSDWFWWSYWPPGYGSVNSPYNTVFESGGNRLELREVRYGHPNQNYRYDHYVWGVNGSYWGIVGYHTVYYTYISGWTPVYANVNHCPS